MKRLFKILTLIAFFCLLSNQVYSQNVPEPCEDGFECEDTQTGQGTGATPIDDYAGVLIITALTIAGAIYYNKEKLSIKNK